MTENKHAAFPDGHFYSPVVDVADITSRRVDIWPQQRRALGIEWNDRHQKRVLEEFFPRYLPLYDYPETGAEDDRLSTFYSANSQFAGLDPRALFVLLNAWRPARMIEVGSGYSTLLSADISHRLLNNTMDLTCIEPHPRAFLADGRRPPGLRRLIEQRVELVGIEPFEQLQSGDVLFIDSSHVAKTGSDVNFLLFEVLPRLAPGVRIHIHDIFLPSDYPPTWVLEENRSWNEQYVVRALLMYSSAFRVLFASNYVYERSPELVRDALAHESGTHEDGRIHGGGSLWLERV